VQIVEDQRDLRGSRGERVEQHDQHVLADVRVRRLGGVEGGVELSSEQVDYLRFMPPRTKESNRRWWMAVVAAGPGWVILGALKQLGGAFLAFYVVSHVGDAVATQPVHQFLTGLQKVLPYGLALGIAVFFVVLSQVKINVTNAYSGSLRAGTALPV
jgi:hypothetical protein